MKPKEKNMKWLILILVVGNYTRSEYITDIDSGSLNDKLSKEYETKSEYEIPKSKELQSCRTWDDIRLAKISRYEQRDENSRIIKLKALRRTLDRNSERNSNDRRRNYTVREFRQVYLEIPRLNIDKIPSSRSISMEKSSRNQKSATKTFIRQHNEKIHHRNFGIPDIIKSIRQAPRKLSEKRFYSIRQNTNSKNTIETTVSDARYFKLNDIRAWKQNSMTEDSNRQVNRESRNNIEQNNSNRAENLRRQNDRHQFSKSRWDSSRVHSRDNIIRFDSEKRSAVTNRFIPKISSGSFTVRDSTEVRANTEIALNRQKCNTLRQIDRRIENREKFFRVADSSQNSKINKNTERFAVDRHPDTVKRERLNVNINSRQHQHTNREDATQSNRMRIRESRREKSENRNGDRVRSESSPSRNRDIGNSYRMRLARSDRFYESTTRLNGVYKIRSSLRKNVNQMSNERQLDIAENISPDLNEKSRNIRTENIQNQNRRMEILREIRIRNSARNVNRYVEKRERSTSEKRQVRSFEINRNMEKIQSNEPSISLRSLKREALLNKERFTGESRLNNRENSRTFKMISVPSENGQMTNIRIQNAKENGRRDVSETRNANNRIVREFNNQNRFERKSTRELDSRRQNIEVKDRFKKRQEDRRYGNEILTKISNIQLRKICADNMCENSLPKNTLSRENSKVQNILLKENRRLEQIRHSSNKKRTGFVKDRSRNDNTNRNQRRIELNLHERIGISRQTQSLERRLIKNKENLRQTDNSDNRRNYIRGIRNRERTMHRNREENIISRDRNIRKRVNRDVYGLQMKKAKSVRSEDKRDDENNNRNIQHTVVESKQAVELQAKYLQYNRISRYIIQQIISNIFNTQLEKESDKPDKTNNLIRMGRNDRQLREKNSNRLSEERIKLIVESNIRTRTSDKIFDRKSQNFDRSAFKISRRHERVTQKGKDLRMLSKLRVNQLIRRNIMRETRENSHSRSFFSKVESSQDSNARNWIENNRIKIAATNRNGRGFRGKTNKIVEVLPLSRQNTHLENRRNSLNFRNSQDLQQRLVSNGNQNGNILRQRNGRGYRGKPVERIADKRALAQNAKELDFIHFVNTRKLHQVINNRISMSSIVAQTSVVSHVNRKVREMKSIDETRQNIARTFIATVMSAERSRLTSRVFMSSNSRQLKPSERRLTRDSNKPAHMMTKQLMEASMMHSSRMHLRTDQRLNTPSNSRNNIQNGLNRESRRESRISDYQFRNAKTSSDFNVRQKSTISNDVIRKISLPLTRQNRRQISHNSLDFIRYSSPREETRKSRMRSILRDEMRKVSKQEKCSMLASTSVPDIGEIQEHSALEIISMSKTGILEKLSSSLDNGKQEYNPGTQATIGEYWKISGKNASSFIINLILGLLMIFTTSERNGIKIKSFKERLSDILLLRSSVF